MEYLFLAIGIILGGIIVWLLLRSTLTKQKSNFQQDLSTLEQTKQEEINLLDKEKSILNEKNNTFQSANEKLTENLQNERSRSEELKTRIDKAEVEFKNLKEKLDTQKSELEDIQKKFTTEFENIANKILKSNSLEFTEVNQKNINEILNPLKDKIQTFEKKVEDTYQKGIKDQTDLKAEIKKLYELNSRISEEANNLTRALKSDTKKQGNWGEFILERVLERSGLVKGQEYDTQTTTRNEQGDLIRPDVIIKLPDNKHIIIDSKVSLVAYEAFVNTDDPDEKNTMLKQHVDSIKNHVKGLSEKNYQNATLFDTPDFVLLFMPMESAFSVAIQHDTDLFNFAWEKKIVIVCPTTLLATLRTIASIWKHEKQTQNALEIAREGGALHDKFVGFLKDLESIGLQINRVSKTYDDAHKKLSSGTGSLIRRVKKLKELGAKASKSIPENLLDTNDS
ncbi:MAG: DNA recombination protein RmuC [Bacteroidales bacterium]|nr:DNA recombination protein RmuC [Bacteroidales bacterium]